MASNYDTTVVAGDTLRIVFGATDVNGNTYNFTGCTLSMQVRKGYYPGYTYASYSLYVASSNTYSPPDGYTGGISATGTGGLVALAVGSSKTINFPPNNNVFYDLQMSTPTFDVETLLRGRIEVLPEVTRG